MFKWTEGRQGNGYKKLCLWSLINFDIYLLKFPVGSLVPTHKDPVLGKEHHRLNIWLRRPLGGILWTRASSHGNVKYHPDRMFKFRPDLVWHGMHPVTGRKTAYMLSIGWTKNVY